MKITLDLSKLLRSNEISRQDYDHLLMLARKSDDGHAFSILAVLAMIAVALGFVGLNAPLFKEVVENLYRALGTQGLQLFGLAIAALGAYLAKSGFLSGLCAFLILGLLGGSTFYSHAAYFVAIQEPAITIIVFAILAISSLLISKNLEYGDKRIMIIFSRTCLILVNMAFWIGSLMGSPFRNGSIGPLFFVVAWALGLLAVGTWGVSRGRRFVVNTAAVFGSIQLYTQWFERLGASPMSLMSAGIGALAIIYGFRSYNVLATQR